MITLKSLGLAEANAVIQAGIARAAEINSPSTICVVDVSGTVIAQARMDGASVSSVELAYDKAYTAASVRLATSFITTIAQPGDPTGDATQAWPDDRERVDLGTLTIEHIDGEDGGACRDINFDPLVLPAGIEASDDPLLSARSAAYAQSFRRRAGEDKPASAVRVPPSVSAQRSTP